MKISQLFTIGAISLSLALTSCSEAPIRKVPSYQSSGASENAVSIYLELGEGGLFNGEPGGENRALYLENAVMWTADVGSDLPGKDIVTNTNGVAFSGWEYVQGHGHGELMKTMPNYKGLVLYATFGDAPPGPIGDFEWFIVGIGSFVNGPDWNASGGIGMVENENPAYCDKEFKAIGVEFEAGDVWKINNPHTNQWIESGWEGQEGSSISNGDMVEVAAGVGGGKDIKVVTSGTYDIYLKLYNEGDPSVWIQTHVPETPDIEE